MPTATRTFRVFVSSTFEDLKEERNALAAPGGPFEELTKVCQSFGARFQAIDLRWGVREEAAHDQRTMEICLGEIERCQRTGIKPNFIVLLGDRYGWRPLPTRIESEKFRAVRERIADARDCEHVDDWYRLDENAIPPEYLLKPRTGEFIDKDRWAGIEAKMYRALGEAARSAGLSRAALIKYEASATHQEILKGLGKTAEDREHVFAFFCKPAGPSEDQDLTKLKQFLREQLKSSVFEPRDTAELCDRVRENLERIIRAEATTFKSRPALDLEVEAHDVFARDRARHFMGRKDVLSSIAEYMKGGDRRPMVVQGASGSGKSAVMARASEAALDNPGNEVVIRRFIGATPESSSGITLLRSLCEQIGRQYGVAEEIPVEFHSVVRTFAGRLALATVDRPLVLFIDAIDQIDASDSAAAVGWLMPELPPYCRVAVSTTEVALPLDRARLFKLDALPAEDAEGVLALWLHDAKRKLQDFQRANVLDYYNRCGLPLYLKLAFEEGRHWRSFDGIEACTLGDGLEGVIDVLFGRLADDSNHGRILVGRSLSYLATARYGLTEDEILDVLSADNEVLTDFRSRAHHEPSGTSLPFVVWSRLSVDLEPYLTQREVPGGTVIGFYHRHFGQRVKARFLQDDAQITVHTALAMYFGAQPFWLNTETAQPNIRKVSELTHQLHHAGLQKELQRTLLNYTYLYSKCSAGLTADLNADFGLALHDASEDKGTIDAFEKLRQTIQLATHTLLEDPTQFPGQLIGRLLEANERADIENLLAQARKESKGPWLRPLRQSLTAPDGSLICILAGHAGPVNSLAVTPDNRYVISASSDGTLRAWDLERGSEFRRLNGHKARVTALAVTSDGRRVISGSLDNTLRVWDIEQGSELAIMSGHAASVTAIAITPGGHHVISGSSDATLKIWDLASGTEIKTLAGHHSGISAVAITPDGLIVISGSTDKTVRLWDIERGWELASLDEHDSAVSAVASTKDGSRVVSGSRDSKILVWDLAERRLLGQLPGHDAAIVAIARWGDEMVSASLDKTVRTWNLVQNEKGVLARQSEPICSMAIALGGSVCATGSENGSIAVWSMTHRTTTVIREVRDPARSVSMTGVAGNHDTVLATPRVGVSGDPASVPKESRYDPADIIYTAVAIVPNGRRAMFGSTHGSFTVLRMDGSGRTNSGFAIAAEGSMLAFALASDGQTSLSVWSGRDLVVGSERRYTRIPDAHRKAIVAIAVTPDGRLAISASMDRTLKVWDLKTAKNLKQLIGHRSGVTSAAITPDGRCVVSGSLDRTLKVWDIDSGEEVRTMTGHSKMVTAIAVTPDGRRIISASRDDTLRIWDLQSGAKLRAEAGGIRDVRSVAITPDGKWAVTAGQAGALRVWDLDGEERRVAFNTDHPLRCCAVSPDGRTILACGAHNAIHLLSFEQWKHGVPISTIIRKWNGSDEAVMTFDPAPTLLCPWCGQTAAPNPAVLDAISAFLCGKDQPPCIGLDCPVWHVDELLCECPSCEHPIRVNPFIVDRSDEEGDDEASATLKESARWPLRLAVILAAGISGWYSTKHHWALLLAVPLSISAVLNALFVLFPDLLSPTKCPKCGEVALLWRQRTVYCKKCESVTQGERP